MVYRFYTHVSSSILLMLWLLILVSGKNIEYSQAVGKSCKRKLLFWKSLLYIVNLWPKNLWNKDFPLRKHFIFWWFWHRRAIFWTASRSWVSLNITAWKVSKYSRSIRTEYFVSLRIQSECGKIRTRINSVFEHFSVSVYTWLFQNRFSCLQYLTWFMFCFQQDQMQKICFKVISQSIKVRFPLRKIFSQK